ncbi:unnamed protein product, partial [Owenia fusiformis]
VWKIMEEIAQFLEYSEYDLFNDFLRGRIPVLARNPITSSTPIDVDDDDADDGIMDIEEDGWHNLPEIIREDIFSLLDYRTRFYASMVCRNWYDTFFTPRVWADFIVKQRNFTVKRFNLYTGSQRDIAHYKVQKCLAKVGHHFKRIIIEPNSDFYNLSGFIRVLAGFLAFFQDEYPMPLLHTFVFTFACETRTYSGVDIYGTGGQILETLKHLLSLLRNLKSLTLDELLLDTKEIPGLMESIMKQNQDSLTHLCLMNCSKEPYGIGELTQFPNLRTLVISPQHLNDEILLMLAFTNIENLQITQNEHTFVDNLVPVSIDCWKEVKQLNPMFRVQLICKGKCRTEIVFQDRAPVNSIIYSTPYSSITPDVIMHISEHYSKTLTTYAHTGLPKSHGSQSFHERGDGMLLHLVKTCPKLSTLIVRQRVSTATLLLIAKQAKSLKSLVVRRNAVLLKSDWPKMLEWSDEFYRWLQFNSRSYERTEEEISKILNGQYKWRMLKDREFKQVKVQ